MGSSRNKASVSAYLVVFGAISLIVGVVMLLFGMRDYSDHTETTEAVVTRLVWDYESEEADVTDAYVDYTVDGEESTEAGAYDRFRTGGFVALGVSAVLIVLGVLISLLRRMMAQRF